jgi:AcrR family transcriptional regulator
MSTMHARDDSFTLEPQAERRRASLVAATAHVVATQSMDAVSHASVASVAKCARTLIYRYFPQREDLLFAVVEAYREERAKRITVADVEAWLTGLTKARGRRTPAAVGSYLERLWRPEDWVPNVLEFRLAVVTLVRDPRLPEMLGGHADNHRHARDMYLTNPLVGIGLTRLQAAIVAEVMLAVEQQMCRAGLAGEVTREEALELFVQLHSSVLQTFV